MHRTSTPQHRSRPTAIHPLANYTCENISPFNHSFLAHGYNDSNRKTPEHSHKPHKCVFSARCACDPAHLPLSPLVASSALSHHISRGRKDVAFPLSQVGRAEGMPTQAACFRGTKKKSPRGGGCFGLERGRLPTFPLSKYHRRGKVVTSLFRMGRGGALRYATLVSFHSSQICRRRMGERVTGSEFGAQSADSHSLPLGIFAYERYVVRAADSAGDDRSAWGGLGGPGKGLGD